MGDEREPYTLAYTAARLHVSESWLQKECAQRRIPHVKLGRVRVFMEHHIEWVLREFEVRVSTGLSEGSIRALRRDGNSPAGVIKKAGHPSGLTEGSLRAMRRREQLGGR